MHDKAAELSRDPSTIRAAAAAKVGLAVKFAFDHKGAVVKGPKHS